MMGCCLSKDQDSSSNNENINNQKNSSSGKMKSADDRNQESTDTVHSPINMVHVSDEFSNPSEISEVSDYSFYARNLSFQPDNTRPSVDLRPSTIIMTDIFAKLTNTYFF